MNPSPASDSTQPRNDQMLRNPFWQALTSVHAHLAVASGPAGILSAHAPLALRYPADVLPFAALVEPSAPALAEVASLLAPGEPVYITDVSEARPASIPELAYVSLLPGLQMVLPPGKLSAFPEPSPELALRRLEEADGPSMVALTELAFPGYFRRNTVQLGCYYGIHQEGELIAMAGERAAFPGFRELSAVCTHPAYRGRGYAATLMGCLVRDHAAAGLCSILHVGAANTSAIRLYEQLGFESRRPIFFHQLRRV